MTPGSRRVGCYICGSVEHFKILEKGSVPIWTDTSDEEGLGHTHRCILHQCTACGHVYQPLDQELRTIFDDVYRSRHAQGPSAMGLGNWGMQRAECLFFEEIDLPRHRTAVEIGCGDGYLLKALKSRGFKRLIGIEPSSNVERQPIEGVSFINDFVDHRLRLPERVDLAYSVAVFEHIEDIMSVLAFCRNNLKDDGELFFVVPNAEVLLDAGDPALFVHQHVHYFTDASIRNALRAGGFEVDSLVAKQDAFYVSAHIGPTVSGNPAEVCLYTAFQTQLEAVLQKLGAWMVSDRVIVHGACNALNNITGWVEGRFTLADNDQNKLGKRYFGHVARSLDELDLTRFERVVIIPAAYQDEIRSDYVARGFRGDVVGIR